MDKGKTIVGAFIVGGCFGLLCQLINMAYGAVLSPTDPLFGVPVLGTAQNYSSGFSLATCGLIMAILFITGILPKIDKVGGFGATIPLFGLVGGVAGSMVGYRMETGAGFGKAFFKATWPFKRFLLIAFGVTLALSFAVVLGVKPNLSYVGAVPYIDPALIPEHPEFGAALGNTAASLYAPISLLYSFIFTGCLAVIGQIVLFIVKPKSMGAVLNVLMGGYILGCLVAMTGLFPFLSVYGTGGITAPVTGAGEFVFSSVMFANVAAAGGMATVVVRLVTFCLVITIQFIWGLLAHAIAWPKISAGAAAAAAADGGMEAAEGSR
jgi:hypothetical protein